MNTLQILIILILPTFYGCSSIVKKEKTQNVENRQAAKVISLKSIKTIKLLDTIPLERYK